MCRTCGRRRGCGAVWRGPGSMFRSVRDLTRSCLPWIQAAVTPQPDLVFPGGPQLTGQRVPWSWARLGAALAPTRASAKREACWQQAPAVGGVLSSPALAAKPPLAGTKESVRQSVLPASHLLQQSSTNTLSLGSLGLNSAIPVYSPNLRFLILRWSTVRTLEG